MNDSGKKTIDAYRSFLLLSEIDREETISQRELAGRLGIALGLVNSYLKNLVAKGYIRIRSFPRNRYGYLLTPKGMAEKSRLAYQHLSYFTNLYQVARQDYLSLFHVLRTSGITCVSFCGVDETAEIAYLSLREAGMELVDVMDNEHVGKYFFDKIVTPLPDIDKPSSLPLIITSLKRGDALEAELLNHGINRQMIYRTVSKPSCGNFRSEDL